MSSTRIADEIVYHIVVDVSRHSGEVMLLAAKALVKAMMEAHHSQRGTYCAAGQAAYRTGC